ncbi:MAG: adenylate kinase [Deltaproteobacteria bacterium]|nr:adenylate kinase [Deltaproteobacteria bacterium]
MNLILLGAPGAGKGTQGHILSERFSIPQISTGDILRANVRNKTQLGVRAKEYMDKGVLVPDEIVVSMVVDRLKGDDCISGFILDGFPRTIRQAGALEETFNGMRKEGGIAPFIESVIGIEVDRKTLVKRLSGRRVCRKCAANYHVSFSPPQNIGMCDKCGGEIYQRDDDKEETIEARLLVYENETFPLIDYYTKKKLYRAVDGTGAVDRITKAVVEAIEKGSHNT